MSNHALDRARLNRELGPKIAAVFTQYVEKVERRELPGLAGLVGRYLRVLRSMQDRGNAHPDVHLGEHIGSACLALIERVESSSDDDVALVVGAVSYFVLMHDADPDLASGAGLVDDARVVNYVIEVTDLGVEPLALPD